MALVGGVAATVVVLVVPAVHVAFDNPNLHVALNAFEGAVAGVLAYLWSGRFRQSRALPDALLVIGFSIAATVSIVLAVVPSAATDRPAVLWTAAVWRVVVAASIAGAAATSGRDHPTAWAAFLLVALALGVVGGILGRSTELALHRGIATTTDPSDLTGHVLLRLAHAAAVALYAVAAYAFARRAERNRDAVLELLATGAVLAALARVHYAVFPSQYTNLVYTGDALRLGAYVLFGWAGALELQKYWRATTAMAVMNEGRRAAREVHDGVLQELAFIRSNVAALTHRSPPSDELAAVADSAERALVEARNLIPVLAGSDEKVPALAPLLVRSADAVASRMRVQVELIESPPIAASHGVAHALSRVVREATTNAVVHGGASTVRLRVAAEGGAIVVTISDDGCGFDPSALAGTGFGLVSMRERVAALGGDVSITTSIGAGTVIDVRVPSG